MSSNSKNTRHYSCSVEAALDMIGNRWKGTVLYYLLDGKRLNNPTYRHPFFSEILSVTEKDGEINELQRQITWH